MDWVNALLPMAPADNLEDAAAANVKGNGASKFSISNWTAYSNTKAMITMLGEKGTFTKESSNNSTIVTSSK